MNLERLPSQITGTSLSDAIDHFLLHQRASRHTARTIELYELTLGRFSAWCQRLEAMMLHDVTTSLVRRFLVEIQETKTQYGRMPSSHTVYTYYRNLKAFFNFHEDEEAITASPMRRVKPPKLDKQILPAFTAEDIAKLEVATSSKSFVGKRDRALIYFLLDTGCRRTETSNMRIGDIDLKTGIVKVVQGKGRKDRITKLGSKALMAFIRYLRSRGEVKDSDPVWVGKYGGISSEGIGTILQKLGDKCGVHANPHRFRRTMALSMLRAGCDVFSLQHLLGHAELDVLKRYLAQTGHDVATAHERYSPVDHLKR
jgi:site-specific recombinase XerD